MFPPRYLLAVGGRRASLGRLPEAACPPRVPRCLGEAGSQRAEPLGSRAGLHTRRAETGTSGASPRQEPGLGSGSWRHETLSLKPAGLQRWRR